MKKSRTILIVISIIIIYMVLAFLIIENTKGRIDINTCNQEALEKLPSIGKVLSVRIIENRPYTAIDELLKVTGIGKKRFDDIKRKVVVK